MPESANPRGRHTATGACDGSPATCLLPGQATLRHVGGAERVRQVESLVCRPATTSHAGLPSSVRRQMGVDDADLRISVGIEGARDLIADFARALSAATATA